MRYELKIPMKYIFLNFLLLSQQAFAQGYGRYSSDEVGSSSSSWVGIIFEIIVYALVLVAIMYFVTKNNDKNDG